MPVRRITHGLQLALLGILFAACQKAPDVTDINESILAFGTFVEVQVLDVPVEKKQEILQAIEKDLAYMHYAYHPWKNGPTGRTNQLLELAGEFTANPSMVKIIERSKELATRSNHLFNPGIGHLMKLWGYHDEFPPEGPPPKQEEINALLASNPRMDSISIRGIRINNSNPAVKLDLGGIAKGYALDEIIHQLRLLGVRHAIINTGGDLKVIGQHHNRPWHIGIRHPRNEGVIAGIDAYDGEAIITSGDYERYYEFEGKRYHHIIDPRTGYPAGGVQSVTVIHRDATLADAAATALFIAGPNNWHDTAQAMGIDTAMLIDSNGKIHMTEKMQQRIHFEQPVNDITIVTQK
jgi:thiamine biosynthesis lipoprotein